MAVLRIGSIVSAVLIFGIVYTYCYGSPIYGAATVEVDDSNINNISVQGTGMGTVSLAAGSVRKLLQNRHTVELPDQCEGEKDCVELGCYGDCECYELYRPDQPLSYECDIRSDSE